LEQSPSNQNCLNLAELLVWVRTLSPSVTTMAQCHTQTPLTVSNLGFPCPPASLFPAECQSPLSYIHPQQLQSLIFSAGRIKKTKQINSPPFCCIVNVLRVSTKIQTSTPQGLWHTAGMSVIPASTACTTWGVCLNVGADRNPKCLRKRSQIMFSKSKPPLTKDL